MTSAVLDTNVLASGILGLRSGSTASPARILRWWRQGAFDLLISRHILDELESALAQPYFAARMTKGEMQDDLVSLRLDEVEVTTMAPVSAVASHPEDDLILAAAVGGSADYLVTGDGMLQRLGRYEDVLIVNPRQFLTALSRTELPTADDPKQFGRS